MTDKSVEDFFAKKDKNKRSKTKVNKSKFTTSDQIAKTLSSNTTTGVSADGEKKKEKKQTQALPTTTDDTGEDNVNKSSEIPQADAEWNDFEDPSSKDYSGLRIQSLQIGTSADVNEQTQEGEEFDENGELLKSEGTSGPWNKQQPSEQPSADLVEKPAAEPVAPVAAPEPEPPKSNKYIPPAKRAGAIAESSTPMNDRLIRRKKKAVAPEITSESDFPSLSASIDIAKYKTKESERNFETVTKGGSRVEDPAKKVNQIEIQNKFSALQPN